MHQRVGWVGVQGLVKTAGRIRRDPSDPAGGSVALKRCGLSYSNVGYGFAGRWGSFVVTKSPLVRALMLTAALAATPLLSGCNSDQMSLATNAKANQPVPPKLVAAIQEKNMDLQSPILVRLFKQEAELEVWKQDRSGVFQLLKTYPICRWSGDLGPKIREGDRQAPEGFYSISPGQMNPQSAYYLSFNTGYPNAFDKSLGRTGSQLMVHGDCSSRGCYAMTDEQIAEIYSLGRESFFGGQTAFQLQAYPFRMIPANFAKHRNNPNMPFWKMLKEGNDHFEVTRQEPKVDFCEHKYVFDATQPPNASRPLSFNASAKCPTYVVRADIEQAVREKERHDDLKVAELVAKGVPVAKLRTGIDGGMNQVFASKIPDASTGLSDAGDTSSLSLAAMNPAPGTIPPTVNPPRPSDNLLRATPEPAPVARRRDRAESPRRLGRTERRRLLRQPRPQGRDRRDHRLDPAGRLAAAGDHRQARAGATTRACGQAAGNQAGRVQAAAQAVDRPRQRHGIDAAPAGDDFRRRAGGVVEHLRQPVLGVSLRPPASSASGLQPSIEQQVIPRRRRAANSNLAAGQLQIGLVPDGRPRNAVVSFVKPADQTRHDRARRGRRRLAVS